MLILSSEISSSSSEASTYLLPCPALALATPWSSCITHFALPLVSVQVSGLILLDGGSSLDEPGVLLLCLNISTSVSVKHVRPDLNVSAMLSSFSWCLFCRIFQMFKNMLGRICSYSFFSCNVCYIFFIWHDGNKDYGENKNKILPSYFLLLLSRWTLSTSRAEWTSQACALFHITCSP